jgi:hypothetical protein
MALFQTLAQVNGRVVDRQAIGVGPQQPLDRAPVQSLERFKGCRPFTR